MLEKLRTLNSKILNSKLIKGFIATILGSGISKVILVVATFMCSNLLGKLEFGELSFVRNTLNMILCICALNFATLCTKFTTEAKSSDISLHRLFLLFLFSLAVCLVLGLILVVTPDRVLLELFSTHTVVSFFRIGGVLLPLFMLQPLIEGVLRGLKLFKLIGLLQTISSLFYFIAIWIGIKLDGLNGALVVVVLYYLLYSVISFLFLYRYLPIKSIVSRLSGFWRQKSSLYTMVLPIFLMSFIDAPVMWIAQVILSKEGTMESVGSMTAMLQIRNLAMLIPTYFVNTYIAFAGELNAQKKYADYYRQYSKIQKAYIYGGCVIFILFSLLSQPILCLYGKAFVSDWPAMVISNFSIPLVMLIGIYRMDLLLKNRQRYLLFISILWNSIWLANLYLLNRLGMKPLYSFFVSQNIGAVFFLFGLFVVYNRDRIKILKYEK